jgi:hypothetical protein
VDEWIGAMFPWHINSFEEEYLKSEAAIINDRGDQLNHTNFLKTGAPSCFDYSIQPASQISAKAIDLINRVCFDEI